MSNAKRKALAGTGRGPVGKTAVVGIKDRATKKVAAKVVRSTDARTLQGFVIDHADESATVYTDDAGAYEGPSLPASEREALRRRVRERHGSYQRDRVVLVNAQAGAQGHLPQTECEAPSTVH